MDIQGGCEEIAQGRFAMVGEELWAVRQSETRASHLAEEPWDCAEESANEAGEGRTSEEELLHEEKARDGEASAVQRLGKVGLW